ncbi:MAG: NAD(+) synthase [Thermoguttaceae bacterium]
MTRIRIAAAVLNQTPLDWENNLANIRAAVAESRRLKASILCLPEMAITGYGCEDAFHSPGLQRTALAILREVVADTEGMIVTVGIPLLHKSALFNVACLAVDGRILGFVGKRFLAGEGLHYEPRWFKPWPVGVADTVQVGENEFPIGDISFECGGVTIGVEICEDAWVAKRPGGDMALSGVDVILNPSASHFAFGKFETRKRLVIEGSRAFGVSYLSTNLLGNEAGRAIYEGGALIASGGRLLAAGPRFSFRPFRVTTAVVDIDATRMIRARTGSYQPDLARQVNRIECDFAFPEIEPEVLLAECDPWESSRAMKEEEFTRAVTLALFDYLRKSRSRGFVVSLSGGADSSAVACLVALMTEMASAELGAERFNERLGHIPALAAAQTDRDRVGALLSCAYQASRNSSQDTRNSATSLADALGAEMACWEIDELVDNYRSKVESFLGRPLTWERDDLALQNIQARVRGPSVWMLANVKGALLLATSNRSEAAVGYATMDGDTCGGLSPIAGIDKAFLRRWLRWLEREGPGGARPIPALAMVNEMAPTAELRPQEATQTDEADLMPYEVLDPIERAAIRDKQTPTDVFRLMRAQFPQYSTDQLHLWVERFFRLWCRNQWKRERYAPSFHLDDENLDPKTWCRFPILSGGFQRELRELAQYVQGLNP